MLTVEPTDRHRPPAAANCRLIITARASSSAIICRLRTEVEHRAAVSRYTHISISLFQLRCFQYLSSNSRVSAMHVAAGDTDIRCTFKPNAISHSSTTLFCLCGNPFCRMRNKPDGFYSRRHSRTIVFTDLELDNIVLDVLSATVSYGSSHVRYLTAFKTVSARPWHSGFRSERILRVLRLGHL